MNRKDVPIELRKLAVEAMAANDALPEGDRDMTPDHILAAVRPASDAMALQQAATDYDAYLLAGGNPGYPVTWLRNRADRIARGEA